MTPDEFRARTGNTIRIRRASDPQCQMCITNFVNNPKNRIPRPKMQLIRDETSETGEVLVPVLDDVGKQVMEMVMPPAPESVVCPGHEAQITERDFNGFYAAQGWVRA